MSQIFPNPIAAGVLATEIVALVTTAEELIEEAEEEEQQSSTATSTASSTSTSSAQPTATEFVIALSQKWPGLIGDAFLDAMPEEGALITFSGLKTRLFATTMSSHLAEIVSLVPVFEYVVPNRLPKERDMNDPVSRRRSISRRRHRRSTDRAPEHPKQGVSKRSLAGDKLTDQPFPQHILLSTNAQDDAPAHLVELSTKDGTQTGDQDAYIHATGTFGNVIVYVLDSGFGAG